MVGGGLTIGGWFAGAVIANFVGKARSILEERHELQGDVAKMLLNVQGSLLHIRAAIDVAERRPVVDGAITDWLQMIKGIASDAEDLLDDFETKRIQKSQQNKVSGVLAYLMKNLVLDDDIHKLKGLLERLDSIASKAGSFIGLLKMNDSEEALTRFLPEIEPVFLGREEEKDKLMSIIFPDAAHLGASRMQEVTMGTASVRIVCIVGEAGVGKTALAQVIYNHPNVKEAFDLRGWVFLSQRSDLNDFFKKIVRSFAAEQHPFDSEMGLEALQASSDHDLSSITQNKRFFLVLDNAKDNLQREWKTLSAKLTGGAAGSIVLVTTRSAVVAESKVITLPAMPIDTLSTILEHHAFGDNRRKDCLKSIGKEIASKMHGLPLSAEVIGRLLRTKLDEKQWRKVSRSEWWDDYEDKAITNHALPSLTIALEFLSAPLKECLGYCSMFPSSYLFDKHSLAHMWMCDSMQQHHESVSETREIQWFDELCSRCLVQPTVQKNKYIVNETIKDILASTTQTGCYTVEDSRRPRTNLCGFSYIAINKGDLNVSLSLREHMKVRSILIFDGQRTTRLNTALDAILPHRSAMRVLDLSCIETNMERPPDVIITYSHLRYLDLSFTGITVFPESFCGLHHLQVLGMRGCRFKEMPRHMNKLVNLRYLYAEVCTLSLIHSIGQLTNLQCLEEFAVNDMDGHRITELKNLNYLGGHLCISNLDKVTCIEVSDTELSRKMYIQKLVLKWQPESASSGSCMQTLSHLKPNGNLEDLEIQFYMGVLFPEWIANHSHFTMLRYIKFSGCQKLEKLPPLGKLSHLKILILQHLEQIQSIGDEFYGSYDCVFPSLEELTFCDMINWQSWLDIKTPQIIPRIRKIVIKNCRRLSDLPKSVLKGSLKELELYNCKEIFRKGSCCLEYLETLKRLKIHNCLGITINIPRTLLASIEVLNLQNCKVCFEGGQEHVHSLRRFLTIDCDEVREGKKRKIIFDAPSPFSSNNVDLES